MRDLARRLSLFKASFVIFQMTGILCHVSSFCHRGLSLFKELLANLGASAPNIDKRGLTSEAPRSGPLSLAPVSAKELKERVFQGVL